MAKNCEHCICYFGGPTAVPPFHDGLAGKCCRCKGVNPNTKEVKKHFKENVMMSGQTDLALNFEGLWSAIRKRLKTC